MVTLKLNLWVLSILLIKKAFQTGNYQEYDVQMTLLES